ncbi:arylamine N-acetyltransferase family protein [Nonomuraea typhae]|uniref:arylamine N-acetyltransferase family protein n=1 Tax=Nonomuraea typhae TaxID=2603600 RepID=UPI0012FB8973|nr:arylamine N-acetyltransferase [Nonomuraea typhae]
MDSSLVHDYLRRIGIARVRTPDAEFLKELQRSHLMAVPFENIDVHLGQPILLGADAIDKVVRRRRGGTCRELNGSAFPELLSALGYGVSLLGCRVFIDGRPSFALAHTVIRADCPRPWLVDVGFGRDGARHPLRLDTLEPQPDPHGTFVFTEAADGDLDLLRDGKPVLRIERRPRPIDDFRPVLWWFESSPRSPFRTNLFCTRATENGRITLRGDLLTRTEGAHQEKTVMKGDIEIEQAYKEHFGITLDRLPPIPGRGA